MMDRAPVGGRGDTELLAEGATERLAAAEAALLRDESKIRFPCLDEIQRPADPGPTKEGGRTDPAELFEARARPLTGSAERSGESGHRAHRIAGLGQLIAQE